MRKLKEAARIRNEANELAGNTQQLIQGNLDITVQADNYMFLGDLATDLNQIGTIFYAYINEISHILSHLSAGNMAVSFDKSINYQGDFKPISNALHKIRHSLNASFEEINLLSTEVDQLCKQVEQGSTLTAKNAMDQTVLINDLSEKINQIAIHTADNAYSARQASEKVNDIQGEVQTGSGYMEKMLDCMEEVKASSHNISQIITMINELAGQSRLLALNAAIEAARAGESGRGFSVVASEVGILAEKSAEAVRQTTNLITESVKTAETSAVIANQTSESFRSIAASVNNVTELCSEIAKVSEIQTADLQNTAAIISDISLKVQDNAAFAQENCAGASNLTELSSRLKKVMGRYRLKNQKYATDKVQNISSIETDVIKQIMSKLAQKSDRNSMEAVLKEVVGNQKNYECLYIIDASGYQVSHTVMNPDIVMEQQEDFKPAVPGDFYGTKHYFLQAKKKPGEFYTSSEYISAATGGLCRTVSCSYEGDDRKTYILCVDIICTF